MKHMNETLVSGEGSRVVILPNAQVQNPPSSRASRGAEWGISNLCIWLEKTSQKGCPLSSSPFLVSTILRN